MKFIVSTTALCRVSVEVEADDADAAVDVAAEAPLFRYEAKPSPAEKNAGCETVDATHPTVKPVALMRWLIRLVTKPGDVVLDPFGGSGTTGVAALLEGRRVILVEQDPRFAAIARARCVFAASPEGALRLESRRKPRPRNRACSVQVSAAVAMNPLSTHPHGPLFARCEASR